MHNKEKKMFFSGKMMAMTILGPFTLAACTVNPGGYAGNLPPLNVAGHEVLTTTASSWLTECVGIPDGISTMLSQFEHMPNGDLRLISSGVTFKEGDCGKIIGAFGAIGAGLAVGPFNVSATAQQVQTTDVGIGIGINAGGV